MLSANKILRNACALYEAKDHLVMAYLGGKSGNKWDISIERLLLHPFAMFECKRVGVEEGVKKGPQTIEKAKLRGICGGKSVSAAKNKNVRWQDLWRSE